LSDTGVAVFPWQRQPTPPPTATYTAPKVPIKREPSVEENRFHNPALAAIRAQQQIRELNALGELNGNSNGVEASLQALRDLASEQQRNFEMKPEHDRSDSSTPEAAWNTPASESNTLKRRISEVSDVDIQQPRPPPSVEAFYAAQATNTIPPVVNHSLEQRFPPTPPKRRPDPNDDTIGSDLDDSEDEGDIDSEDEDEDMPLMLCSYEKVSRTKNKWRANLSHGVVCINGREWVFEKGNGEYEW
jgi:hypothetical protein